MKRSHPQITEDAEKPTEQATRVLRSRSRQTVVTASKKSIPSIPSSDEKIFQSCLKQSPLDLFDNSQRSPNYYVLLQSLSKCELEDESWLSSHFIDFVISQFAKHYNSTYFMSIDFAILGLSSITKSKTEMLIDLTGEKINYNDPRKAIVFVCNSHNIHWNLIRVIRYPSPVLELFEPMGKPSNRHGGLNYRQVPRQGEWSTKLSSWRPEMIWLCLHISHFRRYFLNFRSYRMAGCMLCAAGQKILAQCWKQCNHEAAAIYHFWLWCGMSSLCREVWPRAGTNPRQSYSLQFRFSVIQFLNICYYFD